MDFGASLLRTTFHLDGRGFAGTGQERNPWIAVVRRVTDVPFLPIHVDFRVAAAVAVAMDALMSR